MALKVDASGNAEVWVDGESRATGSGWSTTFSPNRFALASRLTSGGLGTRGDCAIAEILVYTNGLADSDLEVVGGYLEQKYDLDGAYHRSFYAEGSKGVGRVTTNEMRLGSGWTITGLVSDVTSGINVDGTRQSVAQPDISPYYMLYDPQGNLKESGYHFDFGFDYGEATSPSPVTSDAPRAVSGQS